AARDLLLDEEAIERRWPGSEVVESLAQDLQRVARTLAIDHLNQLARVGRFGEDMDVGAREVLGEVGTNRTHIVGGHRPARITGHRRSCVSEGPRMWI